MTLQAIKQTRVCLKVPPRLRAIPHEVGYVGQAKRDSLNDRGDALCGHGQASFPPTSKAVGPSTETDIACRHVSTTRRR